MNEALFYHAIAIAGYGDYSLMKKYRGGAESWEAAYYSLKESGVEIPNPQEAYERLEKKNIHLTLSSQKEYPDALRHIPFPPFGIYFLGEAVPADRPAIAVVGTRRASAEGKKTARSFARELAAAGFAITSGLAFGIDAAAHEGALDAGGRTVAVLAGGLDGVYPQSHNHLAQRILANGGTLLSEYPPGEGPYGYRFIERNRIMSGIAKGVLVVEAPESSGALATARYAVEQDREVFVVPGAVTANNFKGSHALIRQGAELVTAPGDILEAYDIDKRTSVTAGAVTATAEETLILKALAETAAGADVDKLVAMTRLEPRIVNQALSFLLIRGIIKESDAGYTI